MLAAMLGAADELNTSRDGGGNSLPKRERVLAMATVTARFGCLNPTMLPPQSSTPMNDKTRFNRINGQRRARNN